ncbi:AAA family ATPase [Hoeflea olei]|uniref:Kinase n=1 Tax=Hoeflea olei TaxID=1480615 RepID=A0A1C1YU37_9HYPH|nr:ATP-binding protein [Hoeflea olei]OCW57051.1 hypothetical protein AWJ14_07830 [Hoeflea olei]
MQDRGAPTLVLLVGLPGVGKTTLANALAEPLGAEIVSRDQIRDSIFPKIYLDYSREQNEVATNTLYRVLAYLLAHCKPDCLIIDGKPFSRAHEIRDVLELAGQHGAVVKVVHCDAPLDVIRARLGRRQDEAANSRAGRTPEKAERVHREFEPIAVDHIRVDMTHPIEQVAAEVIAYSQVSASPGAHR